MTRKIAIVTFKKKGDNSNYIFSRLLNIAEGDSKVIDYSSYYPVVDSKGQANLIMLAHLMGKAYQSNKLKIWRQSDVDSAFFVRAFFTKQVLQASIILEEILRTKPTTSSVTRAFYNFNCTLKECKTRQLNRYGKFDYLLLTTIDKTEKVSIH